jgi:copper chaperone CopZ
LYIQDSTIEQKLTRFPEVHMLTKVFETPTLYGDHHVIEVRRILLEMPGVASVYASSAFQVVEVSFDPEKVSAEDIACRLEEAGYLGNWNMMAEPSAAAAIPDGSKAHFRHTASYEQTRQVIGFGQTVASVGRPLWPCPGVGVIKSRKGEEE